MQKVQFNFPSIVGMNLYMEISTYEIYEVTFKENLKIIFQYSVYSKLH